LYPDLKPVNNELEVPMTRVLVPLAQGCEELEAITITDLLIRAGIDVVTAGLDNHPVKASRGMTLVPDTNLDSALQQDYDMIVLPGGLPGADHLNDDERIQQCIKDMANSGRYVAAICAAPKVLARAGLLAGKHATAYPGTLEKLGLTETTLVNDAVVCDGNIITSRGPGTAMDFALMLILKLVGKDIRDSVEAGLVR
jgi:4-methyl-5(b-hydroxyethyl)-thiazole monophosphate biosynthesis